MAPLEELLNEVRLLWHRLVDVGTRLHVREPVTLGMRAVLETLARDGDGTVPAIARRRHVTRQHIQALVDALVERKLVERTANPAHRRSPIVRLTPAGAHALRRMKAREARFLAGRRFGVSARELGRAAAALRAVRLGLGGR